MTSTNIPLDSVDIILDYYYSIVDEPIDILNVIVYDSSQFIDVSIYTMDNEYIHRLLSGFRSSGTVLTRYWNGVDNDGKIAPSGKYLLCYIMGQSVVKQIHYLLGGTITAKSDSLGRFSILSNALPVGESFDIFNSDNTYDKTVRILPKVRLEFITSNNNASYDVELAKDKITTDIFIL